MTSEDVVRVMNQWAAELEQDRMWRALVDAHRDSQVRICGAPYAGPDPLGVGVGLCALPASVVHTQHTDSHGRTWKADVPRYTYERSERDSDHRWHKKGKKR